MSLTLMKLVFTNNAAGKKLSSAMRMRGRGTNRAAAIGWRKRSDAAA
jgi:hypothetical protein